MDKFHWKDFFSIPVTSLDSTDEMERFQSVLSRTRPQDWEIIYKNKLELIDIILLTVLTSESAPAIRDNR